MPKARLLVLLLLDERPTLTALEKQSTRNKKEEKSSCLQLKGRAERSQIICLPFLQQPDPDTLSLPPAVHSCGLPRSTTTWSQPEQEADPAENYFSKSKYTNG